MSFLQRVPLPICGVALGVAGLGNLLSGVSFGLHALCGVVSLTFLSLFLARSLCLPDAFGQDMGNSTTVSVAATFPMALMLLSGYIVEALFPLARFLWCLSLLLHLLLIAYFCVRFLRRLTLADLYPSYFVLFGGIVLAGGTSPAVGLAWVGEVAFFVGTAIFLVTLAPVSLRYIKAVPAPAPLQPLACIYAAPFNLIVASGSGLAQPVPQGVLLACWAIGICLYVPSLIHCIRCLKTFYPSWAAFTFPFVISATATNQLAGAFAWLGPLAAIQACIAASIVAIVVVRYVCYLARGK